MTTTNQKGFKIGPPMPDIEGGSKIPQALNNPVDPIYDITICLECMSDVS